MKKILYLLVLFCISCEKGLERKIDYYPNGKVFREYFVNENGKLERKATQYNEDGSIFKTVYFHDDKLIDSTLYYKNNEIFCIEYHDNSDLIYTKFIKNGHVKSLGYEKGGKKIGKWKYYKNDKLEKVVEFINLCGVEYANQGWVYKNEDKAGALKSNNYKIENLRKSYSVNENVFFDLEYTPLFGDFSLSSATTGSEIDKDFCNINKVALDSILSKNHKFKFKFIFLTKGNKNIRGFIREFTNRSENNQQRKVYFDIPILIE